MANWIPVANPRGIAYDTFLHFPETLRSARLRAGLTQAEVATRTGVARPNIAAYETGTREPKASTMQRLLEAVGYTLHAEPIIEWTWTTTRRPYPVPSRLWRLHPYDALRTIELPMHLWWSGRPRILDLADSAQRSRAYEIAVREGNPKDIENIVDGVLLTDAFDELVLPQPLREAWQPLITPQPTKATTTLENTTA